jgi:hypothetical protein
LTPIILTATDGKTSRVNPLQLVGWKSAAVTIRHQDKDVTVMGSIAIFGGLPWPVLETPAEIDRMFQEATQALIVGRLPNVEPPTPPEET